MLLSAKFRACHVWRDGKTPKRNTVQPALAPRISLLLVLIKYSHKRKIARKQVGEGSRRDIAKLYYIRGEKKRLRRQNEERSKDAFLSAVVKGCSEFEESSIIFSLVSRVHPYVVHVFSRVFVLPKTFERSFFFFRLKIANALRQFSLIYTSVSYPFDIPFDEFECELFASYIVNDNNDKTYVLRYVGYVRHLPCNSIIVPIVPLPLYHCLLGGMLLAN